MERIGADLVVETLARHGVDRVFCVPGESYLPLLDRLRDRDDIQTVTCRHESGAGFMAVADAKITGRPGVCLVSRGPGASNATIAVHTAEQDAAPMVLFVGQVPRRHLGRRAFQEVDYGKTFADMAKGVATVVDPERLGEAVAWAFRLAQAPTPGPVVVVLPEDVLDEGIGEGVAPASPLPWPRAASGEAEAGQVAALVAGAERPLLVAGGALADAAGRAALREAAEALDLPVALSFKYQHLFPNAHRNYAGHLGFKVGRAQMALLEEADLVLAVGTRLGDTTTQGFTFPTPRQRLVHVYPDPAAVGLNFEAAPGIVADPAGFLRALARHPARSGASRAAWVERLHGFVAAAARWEPPPPPDDGVDFGAVVAAMIDRLPEDAVLITDAGNFSSWMHRYFPFGGEHLLIGAVAGAMGIGVPAAVAAGLRLPGRQIVCFVGDGGMLMTGNELATAVQYGVPVRLFVANNGSYGTIRLHQERDFPGRPVATELRNPDFARLAEAFGARGLTVARDADVGPAVGEALAHDGPVVVDVRASLERITAYVSLRELAGAGR